jgi:hypothetical protein
MKNIILFENAGELVDAFYQIRQVEDRSSYIPVSVKLVSNIGNSVELVGEGSDRFQIADGISLNDVIYVLAERAGVRLEMT